MLSVKIIPNESSNPPGKLADAELHFTENEYWGDKLTHEPLAGLKLIGFAVWERTARRSPADRGTSNARNVTFPARQCSVNGERRSFPLLRPTDAEYGMTNQNRVRDLILAAYAAYEAEAAQAPDAPAPASR